MITAFRGVQEAEGSSEVVSAGGCVKERSSIKGCDPVPAVPDLKGFTLVDVALVVGVPEIWPHGTHCTATAIIQDPAVIPGPH